VPVEADDWDVGGAVRVASRRQQKRALAYAIGVGIGLAAFGLIVAFGS
jgi:hypothetical protein